MTSSSPRTVPVARTSSLLVATLLWVAPEAPFTRAVPVARTSSLLVVTLLWVAPEAPFTRARPGCADIEPPCCDSSVDGPGHPLHPGPSRLHERPASCCDSSVGVPTFPFTRAVPVARTSSLLVVTLLWVAPEAPFTRGPSRLRGHRA